MTWVYIFWALALLALAGIIADVAALKRGERKGSAIVSLVLKGLVVAAYAGWAVLFGVIRKASGWEDLATFAGILVLSVPVLAVALVLDATIAVRLSNPK